MLTTGLTNVRACLSLWKASPVEKAYYSRRNKGDEMLTTKQSPTQTSRCPHPRHPSAGPHGLLPRPPQCVPRSPPPPLPPPPPQCLPCTEARGILAKHEPSHFPTRNTPVASRAAPMSVQMSSDGLQGPAGGGCPTSAHVPLPCPPAAAALAPVLLLDPRACRWPRSFAKMSTLFIWFAAD